MRELVEYAAIHPEVPIAIGVGLYIWIALGSVVIRQYELGVMWAAYAVANAAMFVKYWRGF